MIRRGPSAVPPSSAPGNAAISAPRSQSEGGGASPDRLAERLVAELRPATALVVGCGLAALVAALREHGVATRSLEIDGLTSSSRASQEGYDLVLCLDALERLPAEQADIAVGRLCGESDDIVVSFRPDAYDDATLHTVRPVEQWAQTFARHGFVRDVDFDAGFLGPWAVRLRRSEETLERVVAAYERALGRLMHENRSRSALAQRQEARLRAQEEELTRLRDPASERALRDEVARLSAELNRAEKGLIESEQERRRLLDALAAIHRGTSYRLADRIHRSVRRALPPGSRRGALVTSGVRGALILGEQGPSELLRQVRARLAHRRSIAERPVAADVAASSSPFGAVYQEWLRGHMPDILELGLMRMESEGWSHRPLVSIVMPVYNTQPELLTEAITSVRNQTYTNWELCIADDASTDPEVHRTLREQAAADSRIRLVLCSEHRGIAATSNAALELATGEMLAFLDHDDALRRHALHRLVELLQDRRDLGVVFSDEDKWLVSQELGEPYFKPGWSPDLLLSTNYLCHLTMMRRELVVEAGGFRLGFDGSQDHDLFLRVTELAEQRGLAVTHLPQMLYIWRQVPGSAALSTEAKPQAYVAGRRAVQEALQRRGLEGTVSPGAIPGVYTVRHAIRGTPSVAVVIPTRDRLELLSACIRSIEERTTYPRYSVVIVDNDSEHPETLEYLASTPHRVLRDPGHFNYSRIMNDAIAQVDADHVVLLNNDITVITPDWIEALLEHSQRPDVGAVGCRLLYPDGRPQHEGIVVGMECPACNLDLTLMPQLSGAIREVSAVTGACMMTRRDVYQEVGGLDVTLRVAYNDVDLCLRLRRAGYRVIYTPVAQLYHHESATRGRLHPDEDGLRFSVRWGHHSKVRDPFFNPHLAWLSPLRLRQD
jgi:GT2 family glycosyltransferase